MSATQKILFLARHAKSSWDDASLDDIDRPLNPRGRRNAPAMGGWVARRGNGPQHIVSSPALRAHTTARLLAEALAMNPDDVAVERDLYFEGSQGMLRALERVDDGFERVMLVGHNPIMTQLLRQLAGGDISNMPTCAIAVIGFPMESWGLVDSTGGELLAYQTPKGLAD